MPGRMRNPSLAPCPLNICPRPAHLWSQRAEGIKLFLWPSVWQTPEHWEDGGVMGIISFLACRESWGDEELLCSVSFT